MVYAAEHTIAWKLWWRSLTVIKMSSRFAVSDVGAEVEENGVSAGSRESSPQTKSRDEKPKMDYLTVGSAAEASKNVDRNQMTVTSVASGNLALYEVSVISILKTRSIPLATV